MSMKVKAAATATTKVKLVEIYRCLCDETRLRILHLLQQGPLCVCHFQSILDTPQVAVSKHLAYLRGRGLVAAQRHEQWMIYHLPEPRPRELDLQLACLQDCVRTHPVFRTDLKRLKKLRCDCDWVAETILLRQGYGGQVGRQRPQAKPTSSGRRRTAHGLFLRAANGPDLRRAASCMI
jgi:ArsR family transcriptional regulator